MIDLIALILSALSLIVAYLDYRTNKRSEQRELQEKEKGLNEYGQLPPRSKRRKR